jgi:vancomycin permeability regulator SanA
MVMRHLKLCLALVLIAFVFGLVNFLLIFQRSFERSTASSQAIVVMGAAEYNGTPSAVLDARLRTAADLFKQGVAPLVILVGGSELGDHFSEAGVGATVLAGLGVPKKDLYAHAVGNDTYGSLASLVPYLRAHQISQITIVSDGFHLYRSMAIASSFDLRVSGYADIGSPIQGFLEFKYLLRETVAVSGARIIGYEEESEIRHGH